MPSGVVLAPPSLLVSVSARVVAIGVVSLFEALLPLPSSIVAALLIWLTPAGREALTVTAKRAVPVVLPARAPTFKLQLVPAGSPSVQLQFAELAVALKLVLAGTVSLSTRL